MDSPVFSDVSGYCARCGQPRAPGVASKGHAHCDAALALEPPRYCSACARRMVVQVTPSGWSAKCVEHGTQSQLASA